MAVTLAKRIGVALLAIAILGAPVLASAPSCCGKGAAAGRATCCCGHKRAGETTKACCVKSGKACCNKKASLASSTKLSTSGCCCKTRQPLPAVPAERTPSELRFKLIDMDGEVVKIAVLASPKPTMSAVFAPVDLSHGPRLQVLFCRWTV